VRSRHRWSGASGKNVTDQVVIHVFDGKLRITRHPCWQLANEQLAAGAVLEVFVEGVAEDLRVEGACQVDAFLAIAMYNCVTST
jgi:hypothetical protein